MEGAAPARHDDSQGQQAHVSQLPGASVVALIVTHNSANVIGGLLDSLASITDMNARAVVLDNASSDNTLQVIRSYSGLSVTVIETGRNVGFGAGVNVALRSAFDGEVVLVVNPDVTFPSSVVAGLWAALEIDPGAAAITPMLVNAAGAPVSTARRFPSLADLALRRVHDVPSDGTVAVADWICGAFMLWRPGVLQSMGGFDERYFLFYEDMDICLRASREGWLFLVHGGLEACHYVGHSHQNSRRARRISRSSRRKYASRHFGSWAILATTAATVAEIAGELKQGVLRARSV